MLNKISKTNNTNRHAEFSSASREEMERFRIKSGMTQGCESGRSMVEMLGVLAVIGVLSVAGIGGYTTAMKKHYANNLLNEARKRAVVVAGQIGFNGGNPSLADFLNNNTGHGTFQNTVYGESGANVWTNADKKFTLAIDNVSEDVCNQMKQMEMPLVKGFEPATCAEGNGNTVKLTFNNDLSTGDVETSGSGGTPVDCSTNANACSGCQTCQDGVCKDDASQCSGGTCTNGSCTCADGREMCGSAGCCASDKMCGSSGNSSGDYTCHDVSSLTCTKNSDCGSGEYCKITASNCKTFTSSTACVPTTIADLTEVTYNGKKFYASTDSMTWWAAENFCLAHGKKLASLGSLGLSTSYSYNDPTYDWRTKTGEEPGPLYAAFNTAGVANTSYWTSNAVDSCNAWYVLASSSLDKVDYNYRYFSYFKALCE